MVPHYGNVSLLRSSTPDPRLIEQFGRGSRQLIQVYRCIFTRQICYPWYLLEITFELYNQSVVIRPGTGEIEIKFGTPLNIFRFHHYCAIPCGHIMPPSGLNGCLHLPVLYGTQCIVFILPFAIRSFYVLYVKLQVERRSSEHMGYSIDTFSHCPLQETAVMLLRLRLDHIHPGHREAGALSRCPVTWIVIQLYYRNLAGGSQINHSGSKNSSRPPLSTRSLDDRDAGVVNLEAHEVRTDQHTAVIGLTCRSQQFFRCRDRDTRLRKA
jgi:hypothetical protein